MTRDRGFFEALTWSFIPLLENRRTRSTYESLAALAMIMAIEGIESRHLLPARRAPRGPEVDDHDLPLQGREIESLAVQLLDHQCRCRLPDFSSPACLKRDQRRKRDCQENESNRASEERRERNLPSQR